MDAILYNNLRSLLFAASALLAGTATAANLQDTLEERLAGDRSGACVAAVHLGESEDTAFYCADPESARDIDAQSRFEIGSLSKALQGLLVARLAERGELSVDEPVAALLPEGAEVPEHEDGPILIRHLLTHTAGLPRLPAGFEVDDPANPYAGYTPEDLLADLAETELASAPGEQFAYSNFGAMLLSLALVERTGTPLPELLEDEILAPLGMDDTSMSGPTVQGHSGRGKPVSNWDFHPDLGGVGAVRSTAADMRRWLDALRGAPEGPLADALARSREVLVEAGGQKLGYGWLHLPLNDRFVLAHDGGTGGFSSFAVVDPETGQASLVLMDTSMIDRGSLSDLAFHLVEEEYPLQSPRKAVALPEGAEAQDYVGRYAIYQGEARFMGDFTLEVTAQDGEVVVQGSAGGQTQPEVGVDPDGVDRFVHPPLDLVIEFQRDAEGQVTGLVLKQAGMTLRGEPL
jgi:CubicO group peptidase (beta-lactamase class C family)